MLRSNRRASRVRYSRTSLCQEPTPPNQHMMLSSKETKFPHWSSIWDCWAPPANTKCLLGWRWLIAVGHLSIAYDTDWQKTHEPSVIKPLNPFLIFWHNAPLLSKCGMMFLLTLGSSPACRHLEYFTSWFKSAHSSAPPAIQKGVKSIIILTMWRLWKLCTDCVFNRATPINLELVHSILDEARLWMLAGPKALRCLQPHARPPHA
jgi:hypothetical protein